MAQKSIDENILKSLNTDANKQDENNINRQVLEMSKKYNLLNNEFNKSLIKLYNYINLADIRESNIRGIVQFNNLLRLSLNYLSINNVYFAGAYGNLVDMLIGFKRVK